jgi:hypothetical protein
MTTWGTVSSLVYGCALPRGELVGSGPVQVFGTNGPTGWTNAQAMGQGPAVVVGRKGAYRGIHLSKGPYWVIDTAFVLRPGPEVDPIWAYYSLLTADINGMDAGSAIPSTRRQDFEALRLNLPPLPTQRAIAEVLGALDDKTAANAALAEAARELRAVSLIRAQTFGVWVARLGAVTSLLSRGKAPRYVEDGSEVLAVNQKCVRNGAVSLKPVRLAAALREPRLVFGDVLINSTGQGTLGRVGIWRENVSAFPDSHVTVARFDSAQVDPWVGAEALLALEPEIESMGEGSTGQTELGRKALAELEIKLPSPDIQAALSQQLLALHLREQQAVAESVRLAELRDTLLPHLMSGRLTVRQAEKQVEEVL